ncbi:MAG: hypothetical protein LUD72_00345 [Bacteroidales bacterium]|nr:hypothetical protein [Bacteroidales bacterium]
MSNKAFTDEEIESLRSNPYTYSVTERHISYTLEFKKLFWERHTKGVTTRQIFKDAGYDPEMLGKNRIEGFASTVNREHREGIESYEGVRPRGMRNPSADGEDACLKELRDLRHEVEYLRQEIEFLKKISSPRNTKQ